MGLVYRTAPSIYGYAAVVEMTWNDEKIDPVSFIEFVVYTGIGAAKIPNEIL